MKNFLVFFVIFWALITITQAQTASVKGTVYDQKSNARKDIVVQLVGTNIASNTNENGEFLLKDVPLGSYTLLIDAQEFKVFEKEISLLSETTLELDKIILTSIAVADVDNEPIVTIASSELADDKESSNISGLLHGSKDVFVSTAGYTLGPMRFRIRGFDSKYTSVYMNDIPMSDMETGRTFWSAWGGLNDVMRYSETHLGLYTNSIGFGDVGGITNIDTRASIQRKNTQITYSRSNKSYTNRLMLKGTYKLSGDSWLTASASRRWGEEGYVEATFYDAVSYFLAFEKRIKKQSFLLTAYGAPAKRGKQGSSTQEVYDVLENNYYNPNWGYQDGEKRNSRIAINNLNTVIFNHIWKINSVSYLKTGAAYRFGYTGATALSWYEASDPRPDYYKNFPNADYLNPESYQLQLDAFKNNSAVNQLNWDYFYSVNHYNVETFDKVDGIEGKTISGKRSQFIIEERRTDQQYIAGNTKYNRQFGEHYNLTAGAQYRTYQGRSYKIMNDLLGGDYYVDLDKYAERDAQTQGKTSDMIQNDLQHPNKIIEEGDKFGYDYQSNINEASAWLLNTLTFNKIEAFISGQVVNTDMWRTGYMQNGKFPTTSLGDSKKINSLDYGTKGGIQYKISGRHYIIMNAGMITHAPTFELSFFSPSTRNEINENAVSEIVQSGEVAYHLRSPKIKASLSLYYTKFMDQSDIFYFYNDLEQSFGAYYMSDMDKVYQGIEIGIEGKPTSTITATGVGSFGHYYYANRPKATMIVDNSAEVLFEDRTVYVENFKESGTPQTAVSVGLKYSSPKYWFVGANANYVDDIYISFNPERRTSEGLKPFDPGTEAWETAVAQEKFEAAFTADMFLGKSFKFGKYFVLASLNVSNIFDNQDFITGGYEQTRIDPDGNINKFPSKYYYYYGRTYFLNIRLSF